MANSVCGGWFSGKDKLPSYRREIHTTLVFFFVTVASIIDFYSENFKLSFYQTCWWMLPLTSFNYFISFFSGLKLCAIRSCSSKIIHSFILICFGVYLVFAKLSYRLRRRSIPITHSLSLAFFLSLPLHRLLSSQFSSPILPLLPINFERKNLSEKAIATVVFISIPKAFVNVSSSNPNECNLRRKKKESILHMNEAEMETKKKNM